VPQRPADGYLRLARHWAGTTRLTLVLPMPVRTIAAHHRVDAVRGCVALLRGPLVFSVEQADLPAGVVLEDVELDPTAPLDTVMHGPGAPIPVTLRGQAGVRTTGGAPLYADHPRTDEPAPLRLVAVPYFLWGSREPGPMRVWLPTRGHGAPSPRTTPRDTTNRKEQR
jgi:uncharacterized protein